MAVTSKAPTLWQAAGGTVTHIMLRRKWIRAMVTEDGTVLKPPHWHVTWLCGNGTNYRDDIGTKVGRRMPFEIGTGMPSCKGCRTRVYAYRESLRRRLGLHNRHQIEQMRAALDAIAAMPIPEVDFLTHQEPYDLARDRAEQRSKEIGS